MGPARARQHGTSSFGDRDIIAAGACHDRFSREARERPGRRSALHLCLARRCPLMVAPAMNVEMWQNAATQRNVERLPPMGSASSVRRTATMRDREGGMGGCSSPQILAEIAAALGPKALFKKKC